MVNLGQIWVNFGQHCFPLLKFSKKSENVIFSTPQTMLRAKNLKNLIRSSQQQKIENPLFLVIFGQKG